MNQYDFYPPNPPENGIFYRFVTIFLFSLVFLWIFFNLFCSFFPALSAIKN